MGASMDCMYVFCTYSLKLMHAFGVSLHGASMDCMFCTFSLKQMHANGV
jgi:hypothetical protein